MNDLLEHPSVAANWKEMEVLNKVHGRGDSMISDFTGNRPLPVRDSFVSIEDGLKLWN